MKIVHQKINSYANAITVDYFRSLNEQWHTYTGNVKWIKSDSTIGVWRIKSLKQPLCKK